MNNYIYIAVMAAVSYTIRVLPLTLIRKPIKNQFIQSFSILCPLCNACRNDIPSHYKRNKQHNIRLCRPNSRHYNRLVLQKPFTSFHLLLCYSIHNRVIHLTTLHNKLQMF
mgnify:CR=1 FL=1